MNKRKVLTILVVIILIALLGFLAYIFISILRPTQPGDDPGSQRPLFPFSQRGGQVDDDDDVVDIEPDDTDDIVTDEPVAQLRKIADFPTTALTSYYVQDTITVTREIPVETAQALDENNVVNGNTDDESDTQLENNDEETGVEDDSSDNSEDNEEIVLTETIEEVIDVENLFVRYNRMADGFIFEGQIADSISQRQVTDTELPNIQEALFNNNGTRIALRFFNDNSNTIETFNGYLENLTIPDAVCSAPLREDLSTGDTGAQVRILEAFLVYALDTDEIDPDEEYTSSTSALIRRYQSSNALEQTGTLDEETRQLIANECALIAEERARNQRPRELTGGFMNENIRTVALHPEQTDFVYTIPNEQRTLVNSFSFDTNQARNHYSFSFSEWLPQWPTSNLITVTTKAASGYPGSMYAIQENSLIRIMTGVPGLTTNTSPNGNRILVSESAGGNPGNLSLYAVTRNPRSLQEIDIATLPEKCVWARNSIHVYCGAPNFVPNVVLPDDWYKETMTFNDNIWRINTTTGETTLLASPNSLVGESMDVTKPQLDPKELYLFFINKKTGEPWVLTLE